MKSFIFRLKLFLNPKFMLAEAFHRGRIEKGIENMMDNGYLIHTPDKKEQVLKNVSFDEWYKTVK
jgi:hypothetical protein